MSYTSLRNAEEQRIKLFHFYRVRQKSSPLKFFAVISGTVWDFNVKFYSFI